MEKYKASSIATLSALKIHVPDHLPLIEGIDDVEPRTAADVAARLCAMSYVIGLGYDVPGNELKSKIEKYGLSEYVSIYEMALLNQDSISQQDKFNMQWLAEAAQALAWTIGLVEMDHFQGCDDDLAEKIPFNTDPSCFISESKLRPLDEIQQQADLLYRMHWYAKNCRFEGKESKLCESTISERRKAIDWAYGVEEDWDEVPMDT
ncbi:DUF4272 domain-containing protein [Shewanella insulae]|uniref:DUF4272 domain-containing protein n=1 Tax=Shewanella insulae TaxID=2681496 RepID=UPI001EFD787B|nr:DUF4272 domain-containing protein [Shewanella insulae]MCG9754692.1 DUF4272 domain-containing protein [Shewanella insulae]